jgi:hypothetical protein
MAYLIQKIEEEAMSYLLRQINGRIKKTSSSFSNSSRYKFSKKNGLEVLQELQQNPT